MPFYLEFAVSFNICNFSFQEHFYSMSGFRVFRSFLNFAVLATALFAIVFLNSCSFKKNIRDILSHLNTELPHQKTPNSISGTCKNQSLECAFKIEDPNLFTTAKKYKKTEKTPFFQQNLSHILPLAYITREHAPRLYISPLLNFPLFIIHNVFLL